MKRPRLICWPLLPAPLLAGLLWMAHPSSGRADIPGAMRSDPGLIQAIDHVLELITQAEAFGVENPELYQALSELTEALVFDRLGSCLPRHAGRAGPFGNGLALVSHEFDPNGMPTSFSAQPAVFNPSGFEAEFPIFQPVSWPGDGLVRSLVDNGNQPSLPPFDPGGQFAFDLPAFTPGFHDLPSSRMIRPTASRQLPFNSAPFARAWNRGAFGNPNRFWPTPRFAANDFGGFGDPFGFGPRHRHYPQPGWHYGGRCQRGGWHPMGRFDRDRRHVHIHHHSHYKSRRSYRNGWFGSGLAAFGRRFSEPGANGSGMVIPTERSRPVREIQEPLGLPPRPPRPAPAVIANNGSDADRMATKGGSFRNGLVRRIPASCPIRSGQPGSGVDRPRMGGSGPGRFFLGDQGKLGTARGDQVRFSNGPFSRGFSQARRDAFRIPSGRDFRPSTPPFAPTSRIASPIASPIININNDPSIRLINVIRNPAPAANMEKWQTGGFSPLVQSNPGRQPFAGTREVRLRPENVRPLSQPVASRQFVSKPSSARLLPLATVGARVPSFGSGRTSQGDRFARSRPSAVGTAMATGRSNPIGSLAGRPRTARASVPRGSPAIGTVPALNTVRVSPTILNYNSNQVTVNPSPVAARTRSPLALSGRTGSLAGRAPSRTPPVSNVVTQNRPHSFAPQVPSRIVQTATPSFPRTNNRIPAMLALNTRQPGSMVGRNPIGSRNQRLLAQGSQRSFQPAPLGGARPATPQPVAPQRVAGLTPARPQLPMVHMARPQQALAPRLPMTAKRPAAPSPRVAPQTSGMPMQFHRPMMSPMQPMHRYGGVPTPRMHGSHMAYRPGAQAPRPAMMPTNYQARRAPQQIMAPQAPMVHTARSQQAITPRPPVAARPLAPSVRPQAPMVHMARPQQAIAPRPPMTAQRPSAPSPRVAPQAPWMPMQFHRPMMSPMQPMHRYGGVPTPRMHGSHMAYRPGAKASRPALMPTHYQALRAPQPVMAPRLAQVAPRQAVSPAKGGNVRMAPTGGKAAYPVRR